MGMTLASLHVLGGNPEQLHILMPNAIVGTWSADCVSIFDAALVPGVVDKQARTLSKKVSQPVLSVWLFDSDAVGFSIFQGGKPVASHILNPDGYQKFGNIPLFCRVCSLPEEDIPRLRAVWRKGDAETQLDLTACLLGLPLAYGGEALPERPCRRETEPVDRWIQERPAPPRIKNQAKAELIQELPRFRYSICGIHDSRFYASIEPYDNPYTMNSLHLWTAQPDGTIQESWSSDHDVQIFTSSSRVICTSWQEGRVLYDSAGLLPSGFPLPGSLYLLENENILQLALSETGTDISGRRMPADKVETLCCHGPDGTLLWQRRQDPDCRCIGQNGRELLLQEYTREGAYLARLDLTTGQELGRSGGVIGANINYTIWEHEAWWIIHDGLLFNGRTWSRNKDGLLTKLDKGMRPLAETSLPFCPQALFFSPDRRYAYQFIFESQVLVLDTAHLTVQHDLQDRAYLSPLGFDKRGNESRFWLQRGNSTVEAWDETLTKPLSRHRLKGTLMGHHRDEQGHLCVVTWDKKSTIFRIFRLV